MKHPDFAKRFRKAVQVAGVEDSQQALGKLIGVSGVTIWSYRNGEKLPRMATAAKIAGALGINVNWLLTGAGPMMATNNNYQSHGNVIPQGEQKHEMPLLSWISAGKWCENPESFTPEDAEEWLPRPKNSGPRSFALRIEGDSMTSPHPGQRSYPHGAIIYVDPDVPVRNGSKVVAKTGDSYTFKVYSEDAGRKYLRPLNPQYPIIDITDDVHICGVVTAMLLQE